MEVLKTIGGMLLYALGGVAACCAVIGLWWYLAQLAT